LTFKNTKPLLKLNLFSEYNIGHWIVAEALFKGLGVVVRDFKGLIDENS
jgi:pyridoxine 5-phosphate synthase